MWWKRENVGEYFPIFSKDQSSLIDYLKTYKILQSKQAKAADDKLVCNWITIVLDGLRNSVGRVDGVLLSWSVISAYTILCITSIFTHKSTNTKEKA